VSLRDQFWSLSFPILHKRHVGTVPKSNIKRHRLRIRRKRIRSLGSTSILPSYGTAGSMIPRYLLCLFLCTAAPPAGFSIYIFINTTVTFIGTSGHSVQMYTYFYLFLRNSGHFYFTLIPSFVKCAIIKP
jgi:hypothetical protein